MIHEKKNLRNKETNVIAFFFVGLFLAAIVYLCVFNVKDAGTIVNNPYNKRVRQSGKQGCERRYISR